jgi:hypothetical protein
MWLNEEQEVFPLPLMGKGKLQFLGELCQEEGGKA